MAALSVGRAFAMQDAGRGAYGPLLWKASGKIKGM